MTTRQTLHVELGWGTDAIRALAASDAARQAAATAVVIDVLSFSTAVEIATAGGATVFPWHEQGPSAEAAARERQAVLAVGRAAATAETPWTLSPASLQTIPPGMRLLLPSPNGATLSALAQAQGLHTVAGCLRNASAVARYLAHRGGHVLLVPGGEWSGYNAVGVGAHGWRTALEDWLGAGAIASALQEQVQEQVQAPDATFSDDALAAAARFDRCVGDLHTHLSRCASGQELIVERGFPQDVRLAAQHDVSTCVPVLTDGYMNAAPSA